MKTPILAMVGAAAAWISLLSAPALALPSLVPYVGELTSPGGTPVDDEVTVTVQIFASASGGTALYTEVFTAVTVAEGRFEVLIGADDPGAFASALQASDTLWVQFTINTEVLSPRQSIGAVPFARFAGDSETVGGLGPDDFLQPGDLDVQGTVSVGGVPVIDGSGNWIGGGALSGSGAAWASSPNVALGVLSPAFTSNNSWLVERIRLPVNFDAPPVVAYTTDESLDDSGAVYARLHKTQYRNSIAFRSDGMMDALHWMAIEPGVHTIDGKKVAAGKYTKAGGAATSDTVFFPELFTNPPVVLLMVDESGDNNGPWQVRIIGEVSTGGFQIYVDAGNGDAIHWIAMDPGEYEHGSLRWWAGVWNVNNSCSNCTFAFPTPLDGLQPGVLMTLNDVNNSGATWLRITGLTDSQVSFRTGASGNTTEKMHYVVFPAP
jgi:hypothetical protein